MKTKEAEEPLELVLDEKEAASTEVSTIVEASPFRLQDMASQSSLNVEASTAADLAANPLEWMASVVPPKHEELPVNTPEWSAVVPEPTDLIEAKEHEPLEPVIEVAVVEIPAAQVHPVATLAVVPSTNSEAAVSIPDKSISTVQDSNALNLHGSPEADSQSVDDTVRSISKQNWSDLAVSLEPKGLEPVQAEVKVSAPHDKHSGTEQAEEIPVHWPSALPDSNPQAKSVEDTAHSLPMHDWAELASNLKSPSDKSTAEKIHFTSELAKQPVAPVDASAETASPVTLTPVSKISNGSLEDTAHSLPKLDWADLAASLQTNHPESSVEKVKSTAPALASAASLASGQTVFASQKTNSSKIPVNPQSDGASAPEADSAATDSTSPAGPDPALVEAVVQRVLDKMRPQVVDIITREFLRPVVQALVHREITKR
jgi:hypothetical protein